MTQVDPIKSGFVPFDLRGPKVSSKYDDPSVPLPPLPDVRRTPLTADEVLVEEGWEDEGWSETETYGRVVPRELWNRYERLRHQIERIEAQMLEGERYDGRPIPTDEERREALGRRSLFTPAYSPLRNKISRP